MRQYDRIVASWMRFATQGPDALRRMTFAEQIQASIVEVMIEADTQRLLVDHRQAEALANSPPVPPATQRELRWPFPQFWCEFTQLTPLEDEPLSETIFTGFLLTPGWVSTTDMDTVTVFFRENGEDRFSNFGFSLATGAVAAASGHEEDEHAVGTLLARLAAYMMAKGIELVLEPVSRQQKRLLARRKVPQPWHIIRVNPRVRDSLPPMIEDDGSTGRHGYRYDVMGHLRFGRHKLGNGEYRHTIEWVRPHQRGLAHERYIPATRKFTGPRPDWSIEE